MTNTVYVGTCRLPFHTSYTPKTLRLPSPDIQYLANTLLPSILVSPVPIWTTCDLCTGKYPSGLNFAFAKPVTNINPAIIKALGTSRFLIYLINLKYTEEEPSWSICQVMFKILMVSTEWSKLTNCFLLENIHTFLPQPTEGFLVWTAPPPSGHFSLASYFPIKCFTLKTPSPWEFPLLNTPHSAWPPFEEIAWWKSNHYNWWLQN